MNIQSEIKEYILAHDFVMLPGIGAFVAEYSQPYFDTNGEIVPSERKVRFNPLLRNDSDVDILQVFRERMNISEAEVQEQYFTFLDTVNEQLATFNRYYWEDFGILISEGPDTALQFLPFQPSVKQPARYTPEKESTAIGSREEEPVSSGENEEEVYEETFDDDTEEEESREGNKALKYLVFALPLALLSAALVYMVFFKPSLRENVKEEPAFNGTDFSSDDVTVDTLYIEKAPEVIEPVHEEHVVRVGIYKRTKDADKIVAFLAEKGYEARIRPHGPFFKVYLVADTEDQAIRYIKEVERLIDDTPIYERKKGNG